MAKNARQTIWLVVAFLLWQCGDSAGGGGANYGDGATIGSGTGGVAAPAGAAGLAPPAGAPAGSGGNTAIGGVIGASSGAGGAVTAAMSGGAGVQGATGGTGAAGMIAMSTGGTGSAGTSASAGSGGGPAMEPAMTSSGCGTADVPPTGSKTIDVDGTQRDYIVTVPNAYDPGKPYRLIFAWHGLGGTATQIASNYYGLAAHAADSAIFIAAQGLPGTGQQSGFASWSNTGDGDMAFTRKMLDWAKASYCIDVKRVFSIGMSNGGMMSNIVGCELGDSFRAIVAMSGGGPEGYAMKPCTGQIAAWISHGNTDNNVPFSYGQASRDHWTKANHCGTATLPVMPGTCLEYQDCDPGFPVEFCEFDGGHMVPSFAGEAGWNFLAQF